MALLYSVREPKTKKARRAILAREPRVNEAEKNAMIINGHSTSETVKKFLDEMCTLKQPCVTKLSRKNKILPFEDEHALEFLGHKNDSSLFMLGNHNKKRPDNIVMGRMYDFHVLDMVEFGIHNFKSMVEFETSAPGVGMRPCFVFCGEDFDTKPEYKRFANLFMDFYMGRPTSMINLRGMENVIVLTAVDGMVCFRHYTVTLHKSGSNLPRVELEEVGPSFDMEIRRVKLASEEMWKSALVKPSQQLQHKTKNVEKDTLGTTLGTVHVGRQDLTELVTKKGKALRQGNDVDDEDGEKAQKDAPQEETSSKGKKKKARPAIMDPTDI